MTFTDLVRKTHQYFGALKLPNDATMDIWVEEAGGFPGNFYDWCYAKLKSGSRKCLENFPVAVGENWREWCQRNPDRVEQKIYSCRSSSCERGFIHYWVKDGLRGRWQRYTARCGHCMLQTNEGQAMFTESQIEANGYMLSTPHNDRWCQAENDKILAEEGGFNPDKWRKGFSGSGPKTFVPFREVIEEEIPF